MQKTTPILPGLHLQSLRRKPRSRQQIMADHRAEIAAKSIAQLGCLFESFIPSGELTPAESGAFSRQRIYSALNTFWAFMSQVLSADGSCRNIVTKIQAYAAVQGLQAPSASTAAYCKARCQLAEETIHRIFEHTASRINELALEPGPWGRRVIVIDGTGASMPDTPENQEHWPQQGNQKPGCGFPALRMVGCFSLHTGGLLSYAMGNKFDHELTLFRKQWDVFEPGDIALADKGFCSFMDVAKLQARGVDSVMSRRGKLFKGRHVIRHFGPNDCLVKWTKPAQRVPSCSPEDWAKLPDHILARQVVVQVAVPGFRTQEVILITTLTDPLKYPADELSELYFRRWDVELFFRDIKISMGMDVLRCQTPSMIRKEAAMHLLAYNCIRMLIVEASEEREVPIRRVSFKGTLQALRNWEPHLNQANLNRKERFRLVSELYDSITQQPVPERPGRSEPRAVKRRPKNHRLLTKPRHEMRVPKHRNRNWENKCKEALS